MIPKRWLDRFLEFGLMGLVGSGGAIVPFSTTTFAQVVADPSIGTIVTPNGTTFEITNGTTVGGNLFHSFSRFDVPTGGVASFLNNPNIVNVFSRVTGGTASQIDGIVRSAGTANLFLMNPSGIVFKQNARLDVGGSFVATTANAIQFGDRGAFSAFLSEPPSQLLTVDPSAFLFNQTNVAPIQSNTRNLGVQEGKSLLLIGGDVTLNNSFLYVDYVAGGRVELGGLAAPGKIDLTADGSIFYLGFPSNVPRANVFLNNNSSVDVKTGGGGSIAINAQNVMLQNSQLLAGIDGGYGSIDSKAGNIDINALEAVVVEESSNIVNHVFSNNVGSSGDINIQAQKLIVRDSQVGASIFGSGNAGKIVVHAFDSVELSGEDPAQGGNRGYPGGLFAQVETAGKGQGGSIIIDTQRLSVIDGSKIQVATFGDGNAGNLSIRANEVNVLDTSSPNFYSTTINAGVSRDPFSTVTPASGNGGTLTIKTKHLNILGQGAEVAADTFGIGNAGDLTIDTERLVVRNGGQVSASTFSFGSAGTLVIHASEFVELSGDSGEDGAPGGILAQVNQNGRGRGGNLVLETKRLSISDGSKIQVATFGDGDAGNLFIRADEIDLFDTPNATNFFSTAINAGVTRDPRFTRQPTGNGGDLTIETGRLSIRNGAEVTVDTSGQGNAGRLLIKATDLVEVVGQNSFLTADVNSRATGRGGSLTIEAKRLSIRDGGQVGSSTFGIGSAGDVFVYASDIDVLGASANGNPSGLFSTSSQNARGNGGNLFIEARNLNLSNSGRLSAQSRGVGTGGNITVNARNIRIRSNSSIRTISNSGDGGNIALNAQTIVALENSDILAFAPAGRGGNITFNTRAFLSDPLYRPSPSITDRAVLNALLTNGRVDVNASGTVSGTVNGVPDISFLQNSLTQLPTSLTDTTQLLANSCIIRRGQQNGSFTITGSGGLPQRPGDAPVSPFPTGVVRNVVVASATDETDKQSPPAVSSASNPLPRPWKLGDPIIEPQGVYELANGELVMSRECK
ncbi:MAG: filamentous hemagglutinin N-terminal domain-containing protein [Lyngbya sp. HA4199-MV5]|jgi:filamentous hemagglutinin family protein|nr:filamentous hemagglutinin N-terminal domain-containing protein [Lyngbya sp. HA4199-MV5]